MTALRLYAETRHAPEVADFQATDLIDALVQSCTGGRTESFDHETTLNLAHEPLPGHVDHHWTRRAAQ
jgi:hypothetical protein